MTSAADLKRMEEERKLNNAWNKVREVLQDEPFGMTIEQLAGKCRYSVKYLKTVLSRMDDIVHADGYYTLPALTREPVVSLKQPEITPVQTATSQPEPEQSEPEQPKPEQPEPISLPKKSTAWKLRDQVYELINSNENGVSKEDIMQTLGIDQKQLTNALLRLRQNCRIDLINKKYVCVGSEPMPVSEQIKERNTYFNLIKDIKNKIETQVTSRAVLSHEDIAKILRTVTGLNDVEWTEDGVVLTQVGEVV